MAPPKKDRNNFGQFKLDDDLNFDFEGMDIPDERPGKSREPVDHLLEGVKDSFRNKFTDPSTYTTLIRDSLPEGLGAAWDLTKTVKSDASRLYDDALGEVKPEVASLMRKLERLMPAGAHGTKNFFGRTADKLQGDRSAAWSPKSMEDSNTANLMQATFGEFDARQEARKKEEESRKILDDVMDQKRFEKNYDLNSNISSNLASMVDYQQSFDVSYKKKSLELQYRQYFAMASLTKSFNEYRKMDEQFSRAIVKNTGLPEYAKIKETERFKQIAKENIFGSIQDNLFGTGDRVKRVSEKLRGKFKDQLSDFREGLGQVSDVLENILSEHEMDRDMAEMSGETYSGHKTIGKKLGEFGANMTSSLLGSRIRKLMEKNPDIMKANYKFGRWAQNPGTMSGKAQRSEFMNKMEAKIPGGMMLGEAVYAMMDLLKDEKPDMIIRNTAGGFGGEDATHMALRQQRAQTDVIPGYLSRILREIQVMRTGKESTPLTVFDSTSGKFKTETAMAADVKEAIRKDTRSTTYSTNVDAAYSSFVGDMKVGDSADEVKRFVASIGRKQNFDFDTPDIQRSVEYRKLSPEARRQVDAILKQRFEGETLEALRNKYTMTSRSASLRKDTKDSRGRIRKALADGMGPALEEAGLVRMTPDGNYEIVEDEYFGLMDSTLATSDINQKRDIVPYKPTPMVPYGKRDGKRALQGVRNTGNYSWSYRNGGGRHVGPMAQDLQRNFGDDVAPDGTKIDLVSMNGHMFSAVQELAKQVDSMGGGEGLQYLKTISEDLKEIKGKFGQGGFGGFGDVKGTAYNAAQAVGDKFDSMMSSERMGSVKGRMASGLESMNGIMEETFGIDNIESLKEDVRSGNLGNISEKTKKGLLDFFKKHKGSLEQQSPGLIKAILSATQSAVSTGVGLMHHTLPNMLRSGVGMVGKVKKTLADWMNSAADVYTKGSESPALQAKIMKLGGYREKFSGKIISTLEDLAQCKEPVVDPDGNEALTLEDLKNGVYDVRGQRVRSALSHIARGIGNRFLTGLGTMARESGNMLNTGRKIMQFGGKVAGGVARPAFGMLGRMLKATPGIVTAGGPFAGWGAGISDRLRSAGSTVAGMMPGGVTMSDRDEPGFFSGGSSNGDCHCWERPLAVLEQIRDIMSLGKSGRRIDEILNRTKTKAMAAVTDEEKADDNEKKVTRSLLTQIRDSNLFDKASFVVNEVLGRGTVFGEFIKDNTYGNPNTSLMRKIAEYRKKQQEGGEGGSGLDSVMDALAPFTGAQGSSPIQGGSGGGMGLLSSLGGLLGGLPGMASGLFGKMRGKGAGLFNKMKGWWGNRRKGKGETVLPTDWEVVDDNDSGPLARYGQQGRGRSRNRQGQIGRSPLGLPAPSTGGALTVPQRGGYSGSNLPSTMRWEPHDPRRGRRRLGGRGLLGMAASGAGSLIGGVGSMVGGGLGAASNFMSSLGGDRESIQDSSQFQDSRLLSMNSGQRLLLGNAMSDDPGKSRAESRKEQMLLAQQANEDRKNASIQASQGSLEKNRYMVDDGIGKVAGFAKELLTGFMGKAAGVLGMATDVLGMGADMLGKGGIFNKLGKGIKGIFTRGGAAKVATTVAAGGGRAAALAGAGAAAAKGGRIASVASKVLPAMATAGRWGMTALRIGATVALAGSGAGAMVLGAASTAVAGVLAALSSPVVLGAAAVAAAGYGAYKGYKYLTRNKIDDWQRIRVIQYGLDGTSATERYNSQVTALEAYFMDGRIGYRGKTPYLNDKASKAEEMLEIFDIDPKDTGMVERFTVWFSERFKPVFLHHVAALAQQDMKAKLDELDKLDNDKKMGYLNKAAFESGPYNVTTSPFKGLDVLSTNVKAAENIVNAKLKALGKEQQSKVKEAITSGENLPSGADAKAAKEIVTSAVKNNIDDNAASNLPKPVQNDYKTPANLKAVTSGVMEDSPQAGNTQTITGDSAAQAKTGIASGGIPNMAKGAILDGSGGMKYVKLGKDAVLDGMQPRLLKHFLAMAQEYGEATGKSLQVNEAFRSFARQQALYNSNPGKAARPGNSMHEHGLAMDIQSVQLDELEKLGLLKKYGFTRPVGGETWHIEAAGIQGSEKLAKTDKAFADLAIQSSIGRGGGGIGSIKGSKLGTRDPALARKLYNSTGGQEVDLEAVAKSEQGEGKGGLKDPIVKAANDPAKPGGITGGPNTDTPDRQAAIAQGAGRSSSPAPGKDAPNARTSSDMVTAASGGMDGESKPQMDGASAPTGGGKDDLRSQISAAAKEAGVDPNEMLLMSAIESSLNPKADNGRAKGLNQFLPGTWSDVTKKTGSKYGLNPSSDPLDIRNNTVMGAELMKMNAKGISGVRPNANFTDKYIAHFLGQGGARTFFKADPEELAYKVFPKESKGPINSKLFFSGGKPLTIAQMYEQIEQKVASKAKEFNILYSPVGLKGPKAKPGDSPYTMSQPSTSREAVQETSSFSQMTSTPGYGVTSSSRSRSTETETGGGSTTKYNPPNPKDAMITASPETYTAEPKGTPYQAAQRSAASTGVVAKLDGDGMSQLVDSSTKQLVHVASIDSSLQQVLIPLLKSMADNIGKAVGKGAGVETKEGEKETPSASTDNRPQQRYRADAYGAPVPIIDPPGSYNNARDKW